MSDKKYGNNNNPSDSDDLGGLENFVLGDWMEVPSQDDTPHIDDNIEFETTKEITDSDYHPVQKHEEYEKPEPQEMYSGSTQSEPVRTTRKKMRNSTKRRVFKIAVCSVVLLVIIYIAGCIYYTNRFCPNTYIDNINCSGMNSVKAQSIIIDESQNYKLKLIERNNEIEYIYGKDIDLNIDITGKTVLLMKENRPMSWIICLFKNSDFNLDATVTYNDEQLKSVISKLKVVDNSNKIEPIDASIKYDESKNEYYIDKGKEGCIIIETVLEQKIRNAISSFEKELNLDKAGCYKTQTVKADSKEIKEELKLVKKYGSLDISILFGDNAEKLTLLDAYKWITIKEDGTKQVSSQPVIEYTQKLADKYNTVGKVRKLHTSWGFDVDVEPGKFGWDLNIEETAARIVTAIAKGGEQNVEPKWNQSAKAFGENDWGTTYVEVNLTKQHLYYYVDGKVAVESDFVSGTVSKGRATPTGAYFIQFKRSPSILRGINWETKVNFWMPFFDGCGLHDATWRRSFGGTIYYYSGSHGCLNMPYDTSKAIYELISAGCPVLVYKTEVEPVKVVPVSETPWPSGYPTAVPTETPVPTEEPVVTEAPVIIPAETPAPVITPTPVVETPLPEPAE